MLILKKRVRQWVIGGVERRGGGGGVGVGCHSLCLVDLSFDWLTLRHRVFPARRLPIRRHAQNVGVVK